MYRTGGPLRGEESGIRWSLEEGRHFRTADAPPRVPAEYFHDRLDEYRGKRGQRKLAVEPEGRAREIIVKIHDGSTFNRASVFFLRTKRRKLCHTPGIRVNLLLLGTYGSPYDSLTFISKWNFVVMDERSAMTFIFRVVQPRLRFVPLACTVVVSAHRCAPRSHRRDGAKTFVQRSQSMRPRFPDGKLDRKCSNNEFSTGKVSKCTNIAISAVRTEQRIR